MKSKRGLTVCIALLVMVLLVLGGGCDKTETDQQGAADYPNRQISMIIPYDPGGGSDMLTRLIDKHAKEEFGNNFAFVYKPGAGAAVGTTEIALSENDGYTIGTVNFPTYILQSLSGVGDFDTDSFDYICQTASDPQILITSNSSKYTTLEEFLDAARENPGKLTVGNTGALGDSHVATLMMTEETGIEITTVPLKGGSDLLSAVLGGHVDAGMANIGVLISEIDNLNILAVTSEERNKFIPDVPTFLEKGYDVQSYLTRIYLAPKGLEPEVLQRLEEGFKNIWEKEEYQNDMENASFSTDWKTGKEVAEYAETYYEDAKRILDKLNN